MAELLGALPLGELHPAGQCALCGLEGEIGVELKRTVLRVDLTVSHVCVDVVACQRRWHERHKAIA